MHDSIIHKTIILYAGYLLRHTKGILMYLLENAERTVLKILFLNTKSYGAHGIGMKRVKGNPGDTYLDVGAFDVHVATLHLKLHT